MNDIRPHLDKIRSDAAECVLLSNLVADGKGEVFARTAKLLSALALEIEKTIATNSADKGTRGESVNMARAGEPEEAGCPYSADTPHPTRGGPPPNLTCVVSLFLWGRVWGCFVLAKAQSRLLFFLLPA